KAGIVYREQAACLGESERGSVSEWTTVCPRTARAARTRARHSWERCVGIGLVRQRIARFDWPTPRSWSGEYESGDWQAPGTLFARQRGDLFRDSAARVRGRLRSRAARWGGVG